RSKQCLLKTPVSQLERRSAVFHRPKPGKRDLNALVGCQSTAPVLFQTKQSSGKRLPVTVTYIIVRVLPQQIGHWHHGIPAQTAPDTFVHVIVTPLRVTDEPDRIGLQLSNNRGSIPPPTLDALPVLRHCVSGVPI